MNLTFADVPGLLRRAQEQRFRTRFLATRGEMSSARQRRRDRGETRVLAKTGKIKGNREEEEEEKEEIVKDYYLKTAKNE